MSDFLVLWTASALKDLDEIHYFLSQENPVFATKVIRSILNKESQLSSYPFSGTVQELKSSQIEYRFLIEDKYKIIYHVIEKGVFVDAVFDTRQDPIRLEKKI